MIYQPEFSDKKTLEKYSSAFSLSDMEIFVFPELLYPLVLANIMSPIIWEWLNDPWFKDMKKKSFNYKISRIKQYIMEHYVFNLDLETWGLTEKNTEIGRFSSFMDMEMLRQSNALFGYEGDKYYFDIDIRKHFGLDSYTSDIIPYWKTETVEAMTAFKYKESFTTGAGECVSLSALYAAALFIVGGIPLESIYLIGTPLHSQNFIDSHEGLLTNNRRIVTKKMWFNGTSMSAKARRALENEKITIIAHLSGYIHYSYPDATIDKNIYTQFGVKLRDFLHTDLNSSLFVNFLRYHMSYKKCFQYRHFINGKPQYIGLETIFEYEHASKLSFELKSRDEMMNEIDDEEFYAKPLENRLIIQDVEAYLDNHNELSLDKIKESFLAHAKASKCNNESNLTELFHDLDVFLNVKPKLPETNKNFSKHTNLPISTLQSRADIIEKVIEYSKVDETALLALYAFRHMDLIDWKPFIKATLERNPVAILGLQNSTISDAYKTLLELTNESIYEGKRLAQPDEVWNFQRGDGVEKALTLANYIKSNDNKSELILNIDGEKVTLQNNSEIYIFASVKGLIKQVTL